MFSPFGARGSDLERERWPDPLFGSVKEEKRSTDTNHLLCCIYATVLGKGATTI
jgi:hypothetical protein